MSAAILHRDHTEAFRDAMRDAGVPYAGPIDGDGKRRRIYVEGDRRDRKNGWYVFFNDERPTGVFGSWRGGKWTWKADAAACKPMSREEREELKRRAEEARARKAAEEAVLQARAAERAQAMWDAARDCTEHPYLSRKGVGTYGVRIGEFWKERREDGKPYLVAKDALLIRMRDGKGTTGLQAIYAKPVKVGEETRDKDFVYGAKKAGAWATIGKPVELNGVVTLAIVEGYATGASVHEATGLGIIVAFDAGNLLAVGREIRRLMPNARLVFAADNDQWTTKPVVNPGLTKARDAAATVGGEVIVPAFPDVSEQPTDWNDLHAIAGLAEVRRQLMVALDSQPGGEEVITPEQPFPDSLEGHPGKNVSAFTAAVNPLDGLVERAKADPGAPYAPATLAALARLQAEEPGEFQNLLHRLKGVKVGITDLRREIARAGKEAKREARRAAADEWTAGLIVHGEGQPMALLANAMHALREEPELREIVAFDEFTLITMMRKAAPWEAGSAPWVARPWTDGDDCLLAEYLQRHDILVTETVAGKAAETVARERSFHPVRDYLGALVWDGTPRVERWLSTYLGAEDTDYTRAVGSRWLISAVARIFQPGAKVDNVLILEGAQGAGKSSALAVLGGAWFTDRISDLASKEAAQELSGVWIVEFGELGSLRGTDVNVAKAFLSRTEDRYRPPYGKRVIRAPRQCVFASSVNPDGDGYLKDATGARRFWPVLCGAINHAALEANCDQLWAEAVHLYRAGRPWWLETSELQALAKSETAERQAEDAWTDLVRQFVGRQPDVSIAEVLAGIGIEEARWNREAQMRVARILTGLEFTRRRAGSGDRPWRYFRAVDDDFDHIEF